MSTQGEHPVTDKNNSVDQIVKGVLNACTIT